MKKNSESLILIVDDSADNRELLKVVLESRGYRVHCASNGVEALSLLHELSLLPDLILLDAQMPEMDGYQFRLKQSQSERLKDIPVIVMTGDSDRQMSADMLIPQQILMKPIDLNLLLDSIHL